MSQIINTPTWIDLGANLAPFWEGFGGVEPSSHQIAPKVDPKTDQKMITFWMALEPDFSQFWLQLGGVKRGPLEAQFLTLFVLGPHLSWSWPPNPPMTPPRGLLDPPRTPPRGLLDPPRAPPRGLLGPILASISKDFACISGLGIYVDR